MLRTITTQLRTRSRSSQGFTLIELMVVVAIVAILASFGLPAYQDYIRKTRVAELVVLASYVQKQVADNALNGLPFANNAKIPTSKYGSIAINGTIGNVDITLNPQYFDNTTYHMDLWLYYTSPTTGLKTVVVPGVIPDSNLYWTCNSSPHGGTSGYIFIPRKWVPESCK